MKRFQSTLGKIITLSGYGVHSGEPSTVVLKPAEAGQGIVFVLNDESGNFHHIPADVYHVGQTEFCTTLEQGRICVRTIEHLMAAVFASGLDNLIIEVSAREIPVLDGGSATYMKAIADAGIETQKAVRKYIRVLEAVEVCSGSCFARFSPSDAMYFDISIAFSSPAIGEQNLVFALDMEYFASDIAPARTFGFLKDVKDLRAAGLALGASLENSVIIGLDDTVINSGGLIADDEFVRHKALDAVGDTALLGHPFLGVFCSFKGGHKLNVQAVRALLDNPQCYEIVGS